MIRRLVLVLLGAAVVAGVVGAFGAEPFLRGLAALSAGPIVAAFLLTGAAIAAAATRWWAVAGGLGVELTWREALAACYRSTFLNSVLPGGIAGDVLRAYRLGVRAVATERIAGQVVQLLVAVVVLAALGITGALQSLAWVAGGLVLLVGVAVAVGLLVPRSRRDLLRELGLLRTVFSSARRAAVIVGASLFVIASLAALFVVACLAVGVDAPIAQLVGAALVVLTAAALPFNLAGWGPREAAAVSVFAAVGLASSLGVAASTAFGALSLISVLPGAVLLLVHRVPSPSPAPSPAPSPKESPA